MHRRRARRPTIKQALVSKKVRLTIGTPLGASLEDLGGVGHELGGLLHQSLTLAVLDPHAVGAHVTRGDVNLDVLS